MTDSGTLSGFACNEGLPGWWATQMETHLLPWLRARLTRQDEPWILGLHGPQGSGKSTLARALCHWAENRGMPAIHLSLDDYYLGRAQRSQLADALHPLLATRGVPGTHAVCRLLHDLRALKQGRTGLSLPRFLKETDDVAPVHLWQAVSQKPRLIVFEGWCLGLPHQTDEVLQRPLNELERQQDPQALWRRYVNEQLAGPYRELWAEVDGWLMLVAPGFHCVEAWRWQQEEALRDRLKQQGVSGGRLMSRQQLSRFLQHYQRWTEHGLRVLPARMHRCLHLDPERRIVHVREGDGRVLSAS